MKGNYFCTILLICFIGVILSSCMSTAPVRSDEATIEYSTALYADLLSLPAPKSKIIAAVYNFTDQTGQFKNTAAGNASNSRLVTQGADSMAVKALMDSNWFVVVERGNLQNLINERKIIDLSTMSSSDTNDPIPFTTQSPLLFANVIIEGGIIAYESNIVTGGAGLKYMGIGGSGRYQRDQVTVFLRVVSTKTGQVLKTVHATKSIVSTMVDVGVYRFFDEKKLLEIEAGFSVNEPVQLCVKEAIEKAVLALIIEGIHDRLWELNNPDDMNSPVIREYRAEQERSIKRVDTENKRFTGIGIGLNSGINFYTGDYRDLNISGGGELVVDATLFPLFTVLLKTGVSQLSVKHRFTTLLTHIDLGPRLNFDFNQPLIPTIFAGVSLINYWIWDEEGIYVQRNDIMGGWKLALTGSVGLEYFFSPHFGVNVNVHLHYPFTDQIDGYMDGMKTDFFWGVYVGVKYNIILPAIRTRRNIYE